MIRIIMPVSILYKNNNKKKKNKDNDRQHTKEREMSRIE